MLRNHLTSATRRSGLGWRPCRCRGDTRRKAELKFRRCLVDSASASELASPCFRQRETNVLGHVAYKEGMNGKLVAREATLRQPPRSRVMKLRQLRSLHALPVS